MGDTNISVELGTNEAGETISVNVMGGVFTAIEPVESQAGLTGIAFATADVGGVIVGLENVLEQLKGLGAATS